MASTTYVYITENIRIVIYNRKAAKNQDVKKKQKYDFHSPISELNATSKELDYDLTSLNNVLALKNTWKLQRKFILQSKEKYLPTDQIYLDDTENSCLTDKNYVYVCRNGWVSTLNPQPSSIRPRICWGSPKKAFTPKILSAKIFDVKSHN